MSKAEKLLSAAMNKGDKPTIIADTITVKELNMGSTPPELELIEIGDLEGEKFRGVFRLKYAGDAHLVIQTKVQANPLINRSSTPLPFSPVQMVAADAPLTVPMFLQLSDIKVNGIVILLFTQHKGLSMVFRNDPLDHVKVTSTFDSVPVIRDFLQCQIEHKLKLLFADELPAIVKELSMAWTGAKKSPKVRATHIEFTVPSMDNDVLGGSGYNTPRSIPHLYRNQSFTGRGVLSPFTPAIAQAIYKSTSLSALDLAERKAKSVSPKVSPKKAPRKKHSIVKLGQPAPLQAPASDPKSMSYFDKEAPKSGKTWSNPLTPISEKTSPMKKLPLSLDAEDQTNTTDAKKLEWLEARLREKIENERQYVGLNSPRKRLEK